MAADWDLDFSYGLLRDLYSRVRGGHRLGLLGQARELIPTARDGDRVAFIRHDVDVSLSRARSLAAFEQSLGVRTTYHVMLRSPFYDPESASGREDLAAIAEAGHEVGLHFWTGSLEPPDADTLEAAVAEACARLEELTRAAVRSVSFHIPPPSVQKGPPRIGGRVNAYAADLMTYYLSDSCGRWREGDPRVSLDAPRSTVLQILVHPIWWGEAHLAPPDRLGLFVEEVAARAGESFEEAAEAVYRHILFRARKPSPT